MVLQMATYRRPELSLRLFELDWRAPICPSRRCSEMDVNQSLAMEIYMKLCGILPYLIYLRRKATGLANECRHPAICIGFYAVPSTIPTTIQEITLPMTMRNTMTITIQNTMPYLFRSYITIPNEIPTQTRRYRARQVQWQLMTAIDFWIKPFQSMFLTKLYEISRRRSNNFQNRGMRVPESQPLPRTITFPVAQEWCTV